MNQAGDSNSRTTRILLRSCAFITLFSTIGIVALVGYEAASFFDRISFLRVIADWEWTPLSQDPKFGIWPLFTGSLWSIGIAMFLCIPPGIFLAICLSELVPGQYRRWIKPILDVLAGIPAVAFGLFAFTFVTPSLQVMIPELDSFNILVAGIVLGLMILPLMTSLSENALQQVPQRYRETAIALGATPWTVAFRIVTPAALPGLISAAFLSLARGLGESLIVAMAAGTIAQVSLDPTVSMQTLSSFLLQSGLSEVTGRGTGEHLVFAIALILLLMTFAFHQLGLHYSVKHQMRMVE